MLGTIFKKIDTLNRFGSKPHITFIRSIRKSFCNAIVGMAERDVTFATDALAVGGVWEQ
jgi:hypothetical protein